MSVPTMFTMPTQMLFPLGLPAAENTHYQLSYDELLSQCNNRNKGELSDTAELPIHTAESTARYPKDCFIVKDKTTANIVTWNEINQPIDEKYFDSIYQKLIDHYEKKEIWIRDFYACEDMKSKLSIRIINEDPASNLLANNMFLQPTRKELENFNPDWYIIHAPTFFANPSDDGTKEGNFTIINFTKKVMLIGGSSYSEIKVKKLTTIFAENLEKINSATAS